jgi:hypothetical protein
MGAEERGLRVAVWAQDVDDREGHEESFLREIQTFHTTGRFETPKDLADEVGRRLRYIASEDLAPWVKLGPAVFRGRRIKETAGRASVLARVWDPTVLAHLEDQRSDRWGRMHELTLTYSGRVRRVSVEDIETTTTASSGADVHLVLSQRELPRESFTEMSVSAGGRTYSPQDLCETALRQVLFGETEVLDALSASMSSIPDPFAPVRELRLSEEIIRPIAHLLLTEALVGSGRASRITLLRLGPQTSGARRCILEWEAPRGFAGIEPERRRIEGSVRLA